VIETNNNTGLPRNPALASDGRLNDLITILFHRNL
jgi:hypothetical protein